MALLIGFILTCFASWFYIDEADRETIARRNSAYRVASFHLLALAFVFVSFATSVRGLVDAGEQPFTEANVSLAEIYSFSADLALKGMFFDVMEHFKLTTTRLELNRNYTFFVWYSFIFRLYFSLMGVKIAISGLAAFARLFKRHGLWLFLPRELSLRTIARLGIIGLAIAVFLIERFVNPRFFWSLLETAVRWLGIK